MFALFLSAAWAATIPLSIDFSLISNAPATDREMPSVQHVGHSDETIAIGSAVVQSTWAPLACEIVAGELYLTLDDRNSASWPTIPATATCTKVYGGNTWVGTISLAQYSHDWTHEGVVTTLAVGADFRLGAGESCSGATSPLPAGSVAYTVGTVTAVKTGGGAWTGVTCEILNAKTGAQQFLRVEIAPASVATTGTCTVPKAAGGSSVVPVSVTR